MLPMPAKKVTKKRLGLDVVDPSLKKHPSVKSLFDENGNQKLPSDNISNDILTFKVNINNNNNDNLDNIDQQKKAQTNLSIKINACESKLADSKETFFLEIPQAVVKNDNKKIITVNEIEESESKNNINNSFITINGNNLIHNKKNENSINIKNTNDNNKFIGFDNGGGGENNKENNIKNNGKDKNSNNIYKNKKLLGFGLNDNKLKSGYGITINTSKPEFYKFNEHQQKFDKEITDDIKEGKDYCSIEKKFLSYLKKSEE